ncbi:MAG TPA: glycogen/starch/alpha-glucan phosphorylase [Gemmataceae bacterium]|nr:glycogen/starch/alpha-glucan phosphorylase [Gemmataceae bacterium]
MPGHAAGGATIEMAEEAGEENFFLFGLTADQVANSRGWYDPNWHYDHEPETRAALDLIFSDHFSRTEASLFAPLRDTLLRAAALQAPMEDGCSSLVGAGVRPSAPCRPCRASPEVLRR